jgi:hypothetical protein
MEPARERTVQRGETVTETLYAPPLTADDLLERVVSVSGPMREIVIAWEREIAHGEALVEDAERDAWGMYEIIENTTCRCGLKGLAGCKGRTVARQMGCRI